MCFVFMCVLCDSAYFTDFDVYLLLIQIHCHMCVLCDSAYFTDFDVYLLLIQIHCHKTINTVDTVLHTVKNYFSF
jgi:hypothetical protein